MKHADVQPLKPTPPAWLQELFGRSMIGPPARDRVVDVTTSGPLSLFSTTVRGAVSMRTEDLRREVSRAYSAIADALGKAGLQPMRFWNFLPSPGEPMGDGLDRYMVFNAGRFDAYVQWYGTPRAFSGSLATASAVGVAGNDYVLFCLASPSPVVPVENPRQTPAWNYSPRYGPKPPCFARATIAEVEGLPRLLIGGTASIVGEESVHVGDVASQAQETLRNLSALIAAARRDTAELPTAAFARITSLRIYIRSATDAEVILAEVEPVCRADVLVEAVLADVCRPELLVEMEAIANL